MLSFNRLNQAGSEPAAVPIRRQPENPADIVREPLAAELPELHDGSAGAAIAEPLDFSVRYSLLEYVGFMWQHGGYLIRRRQVGFAATWYMLAKSTASAALHFVLQGRSRHAYQFTVDCHGVVRTSPSGVTLIPWADVSAIRTYSRGFMMVLQRGTLPIPFRCLSREQSGAFTALAASFAPALPAQSA